LETRKKQQDEVLYRHETMMRLEENWSIAGSQLRVPKERLNCYLVIYEYPINITVIT